MVKMKDCLFTQVGLTTIAVYPCIMHSLMVQCCMSRAHDDVISNCGGRRISNLHVKVGGGWTICTITSFIPICVSLYMQKTRLAKGKFTEHKAWSQTHAQTINATRIESHDYTPVQSCENIPHELNHMTIPMYSHVRTSYMN